MLELAFTAWSLWNFSLVFADVTLMQCQIGMGVQIEMAKWRCQKAGQFAKL